MSRKTLKELVRSYKEKGFSQRATAKLLSRSAMTVRYYWSDELQQRIKAQQKLRRDNYSSSQKEEVRKRNKEMNERNPFYIKICSALSRKKRAVVRESIKPSLATSRQNETVDSNIKRRLRLMDRKSGTFVYKEKSKYYEVLERFKNESRCYLTGRPINLFTDVWEIDHIVPKMNNGSNEPENLGLCTHEANKAKAHMSVDEFVNLCKDVLTNFGYTVTKDE